MQILRDARVTLGTALIALLSLSTLKLWLSYRKFRIWFVSSLLIPVGAAIFLCLRNGHPEIINFVQARGIKQDEMYFFVPNDRSIPDSENAYYLQNQWLENHARLFASGAIFDEKRTIAELSGIVALSYSTTKSGSGFLPPEYFHGLELTDRFITLNNRALSMLRFKFVDQRMMSFVSLIELLNCAAIEKKLLATWSQEIGNWSPAQKQELKTLLNKHNGTEAIQRSISKEYDQVKYHIAGLYADQHIRIPRVLFDIDQTMRWAARYFTLVKETGFARPNQVLPNQPGMYIGYNMVGYYLMQSQLPRLSGILHALDDLEKQRANILTRL